MSPAASPRWPTALPLVAILRGIEPQEAVVHARALLDAGFDCIEVPTNSPDWAASVRAIAALVDAQGTAAAMRPPAVLVGAGTVLSTAHLDALQAAGGRLAVSPHVDVALAAEAVRRGLVTIPGAMTPSEVLAGWRAGALAVKVFPAATLGTPHVRAMRAVLPSDLPLLAVGGVTVDNLAEFIAAGCIGAGLGSDLYRPGQSPIDTAQRGAAFVAAFRAARG